MRVPVRFLIALALAGEVVATLLVAQAIGVGWTILWLAAAFLVGLVAMRRAGSRAGAALRLGSEQAGAQGGVRGAAAGAAVAGDAVLLFLAGALLAFPGVLGDVVGALLLVPAVRRLLAATVVARAVRRYPRLRIAFARVQPADGPVIIPGEVVDESDDPDPTNGGGPGGSSGGRDPRELPPAP